MPSITSFIGGGGPIIPGTLFPFLFVTIACGAISGFHSLVASGTTPKMIARESDTRMIGYGAMLMEGLVGIVALIAACALEPGDYFAINVPPAVYATLGMSPVNLAELSREVGENVAGRTGGAVSLAVGFAQIFTALPGLQQFMSFWYHFAIMFEALFILTTIDAGTRVARFMVQEFGGRFWKPFERTDWLPANTVATTLVVASWGYFLWTGNISTIWPMFGTANQLLAAVALSVGTSILINGGKTRYAWITAVPMAFVAATTLSAGVLNITDNFWPLTARPATAMLGYVNSGLTVVMILCALTVLAEAGRRWYRILVLKEVIPVEVPVHDHRRTPPRFGGCC
jgi:carbon starvation protein